MGSIMDKWFGIDPPKAPKAPAPLAPLPTADSGGGLNDALRRSRRRSGRSNTILTGDLVPMDVGKRSLLG